MRKKEKKRKIREDTVYSLLVSLVLVYGIMVLVYIIYLILALFKAI